jgi:hypothetical protein
MSMIIKTIIILTFIAFAYSNFRGNTNDLIFWGVLLIINVINFMRYEVANK